MEDRFEDLPETFDQMLLLPNVPDFSTTHRIFTAVHQIVASSCAFLKKEARNRPKGWTVPLDSIRRHINPPCGIMKDQVFFPLRGLLFFACNGKDVVAFARNDDFGKPSPMEPFSQRLRDKPRVHSQGNLGDINTFTIKFSFQTGEHEN